MAYRLVDSPPPVKDAIGLSEKEAEALRTALGRGLEEAGRLVRDEWVSPFVIAGAPGDCAGALADLARRTGFAEFIVPVPDLDVAEETMSIGAEVLSLLR
jgi:alkanesulfonate monooxygenase SsuD/methylene tetrahydromethanopterin reductase-like flavin-dependent oxidoreductase (luciferase family)